MGKLITKTFRISGMKCAGCEEKVEKALSGWIGVSSVQASFGSGTATVTFDPSVIDESMIAEELKKAGYPVTGEAKAGKPVREAGNASGKSAGGKMTAGQFAGIAVLLLAGYFVVKNTVGFNFIPQISQSMGYGMLLIVGLLTSLHCAAMCGGINISQCAAASKGAPDASKKLVPSLLYNLGRVVSYTIIGGLVGALGSVISFSGWARGLVAVVSGVFMVVIGLSMTGLVPWINRITPRVPSFVRRKAGKAGKGKGPFVVGLLNGLMPCGPLQSMQLYALGTGGFLAGAASMFFFSLGTVPLMFGLGALSSLLSAKFTDKMMKVSSVLILVLGVVMLSRGLTLSGVALPSINITAAASSTGAGAAAQNTAQIENGVQTITTDLTSTGYPVITVQKGVPVKWNLRAGAGTINSCNGTLIIPKYNIQLTLQPGDNWIEFTPDQTGTIPYSCWMGMVRSKIAVVDDLATAPPPDSSGVTSGAGGCCGVGASY